MSNQTSSLKLNTKRTMYIGLAFFTILMLWQTYNYYVPKFLGEGGFGLDNYLVGIIMAVDNMLALFMAVIFGKISDKTNTKIGKRMPYIIAGTIIALVSFPFVAVMFVANNLAGMVVVIAIVLIAMNVYRAPSVSLMPDITPKPLRDNANGIINFMGYIGAIFASVIATFFVLEDGSRSYNIVIPFVIVSVLMLTALIVLFIKIKENKIAAEMAEEMEIGEDMSVKEDAGIKSTLSSRDKFNLKIIIISVFFWFLAFNAIETFWSLYGENYLHEASVSMAPAILAIASLLTFIPAGNLSAKIGRKKVVMIGLSLIIGSLSFSTFITNYGLVLNLLFAISGIGWAMINVSSYPMVVELADKENIGKFTGYYYTSSMIAQSITPVCIGMLMDLLGWRWFFPYATVFMLVALIIFTFFKTNKISTTEEKRG